MIGNLGDCLLLSTIDICIWVHRQSLYCGNIDSGTWSSISEKKSQLKLNKTVEIVSEDQELSVKKKKAKRKQEEASKKTRRSKNFLEI